MEFCGKPRFGTENNLALSYHQLLPCFTLTYHTPNEVMRVYRLGAFEKAPKICDINLTLGGWGTLCLQQSFPGQP